MRECIGCYDKKPDTEFDISYNRCKACRKKRRYKEYHSDIETARLEARIYSQSPKAMARKLKNFMKRYEKTEVEV